MTDDCARIRELLDDLIDGELDSAAADRMTDHLRRCGSCRAEESAALEFLALADGIRDGIEPKRDLWPAVRTRIEGAKRERRPSRSARGVRLWAWSATAAAVVLAAALAAALTLHRGTDNGDGHPVAAGRAEDSRALLAAFDEADRDFVRSRDALLAELDARSDELDPDVARFVADNLDIMDRAAREIRAALETDPADPGLRRMLLASYRKRLDLLRIVREIPVGPSLTKEAT